MGTSISAKANFYIDITNALTVCLCSLVSGQSYTETRTGWSCRQHRGRENKTLFLSILQSLLTHFTFKAAFNLFPPSLCQCICPPDWRVAVLLIVVQDYKRSVSVTWPVPEHNVFLLLVSMVSAQLPTETIIVNMCFVVVFSSTLHMKPTPTPSLHHTVFVHALSMENETSLGCNVPRLVSLLPFSACPGKISALFYFCKNSWNKSVQSELL